MKNFRKVLSNEGDIAKPLRKVYQKLLRQFTPHTRMASPYVGTAQAEVSAFAYPLNVLKGRNPL